MKFYMRDVSLAEYPTVKSWAEKFGEKKLHYVRAVLERLRSEELEEIERELRGPTNGGTKGGNFIRTLKRISWGLEEKVKESDLLNIVRKRFYDLKFREGWREWEDRFGEYCLRKWRERKTLYDAVYVISGECAYDKARPGRLKRRARTCPTRSDQSS